MKENWLKMYDKFGLILRVETVINQPREFRVFREGIRKGEPQMVWAPMNKGVANLPQYERHAKAANERYLNALSVVDDPRPAYQQVAKQAESKVHKRPKLSRLQSRPPGGHPLVRSGDGGGPLHQRFQERRHPSVPVWFPSKSPTSKAAGQLRHPTAQTLARPRPDRENPAHKTLANNGPRPKTAQYNNTTALPRLAPGSLEYARTAQN